MKVIFSSKGRHKLNVTPLIATFQKCIVLQHQKSLKKAQKSFTDYLMTMCQVWEELRVGRGLGVLPARVPRVPRVRGGRGQDRGRRGGRHGGAPLAGGPGQVGANKGQPYKGPSLS